MAAPYKLVIDTRRSKSIQSFRDGSGLTPPPVFQGSVLNLDITLVEDADTYPNPPFAKIDPTTDSLDVGIGVYNTDSAATPAFRQNSFTQNSTLLKYTGTLTITESVAETLLGSNTSRELRLTVHYGSRQVLDAPVMLYAHTNGSGSNEPSPSDSYLTEQQTESRFVRKSGNPDGTPIILPSASGNYQLRIYCGDDGEAKFDVYPT